MTRTTEFTDQDFVRMREFIGVELCLEQYCEEASTDTIRHYAYGIGDDNPLWVDQDYARSTRHGGRIAPPTFVYAIHEAETSRGLPSGVQAMHVASGLSFDRPIRLGERVTARSKLLDVRDVIGKRAGRMAVQVTESTYLVGEERVATALHTIIAITRSHDGSGVYGARERSTYTSEAIDAIEEEMLAQTRRGATPRYWEDVVEGESLPTSTKPPLDQMAMTCYYAGAIGSAAVYKTGRVRAQFRELVRSGSPKAPTNWDPWLLLQRDVALGHQDGGAARMVGMPGAYDNGNQRTAACAQLITDWMGDDADLKKVTCEVVSPRVYGDLLRLTGTVTRKFVDNGKHLVEINATGCNQFNENTTNGTAVVQLPTRPPRPTDSQRDR
jgi:acyl dehydratase